MKIVPFLRKNGDHPKRVVDFHRERDTFRNKMVEIVKDFDETSHNNNGKPWISSRILLVKPNFFIFPLFNRFFFIFFVFFSFFFVFFRFFRFFQCFHFFIFFIFSCFSFSFFCLSFSFIFFHVLSICLFLFFFSLSFSRELKI